MDSPANLIPMSSKSNKKWDSMEPAAAINSLGVKTQQQIEQLRRYFVDKNCIDLLGKGQAAPGDFLEARAQLIQEEILRLMRV